MSHRHTPASQHPDPARQRKRRLLLFVLPIVVVLVRLAFYLHGGRDVETDNAYIKAQKVPVSPSVAGDVVEVLVNENQAVEAGQLLFRIDSAPFRIALDKAEAKLAQVRTELSALQLAYRAKQEEVALARNNQAFTEKELQRQQGLAERHFISAAKLDDASHAADVARQQRAILEQDLQRMAEALGGDPAAPIQRHPSYRSAQAELEQARLDLQHCEVHAPQAGIASKAPKVGQFVAHGNPAMLVVSEDVWIEANFTEGDLTYVQPGQAVRIEVDTYPDADLHGTVESLAPATGAEYSVIPAQNATGNWIKIAQRLTVRIRLQTAAAMPALRAGMSSWVEIDTGHHRRLLGITL